MSNLPLQCLRSFEDTCEMPPGILFQAAPDNVQDVHHRMQADEPNGAAGETHPGAALQDILRLLTLWFNHGSAPDVEAALQEGFGHVSIDTWLVVIPQVCPTAFACACVRLRCKVHTLFLGVQFLTVQLKQPAMPCALLSPSGLVTCMLANGPTCVCFRVDMCWYGPDPPQGYRSLVAVLHSPGVSSPFLLVFLFLASSDCHERLTIPPALHKLVCGMAVHLQCYVPNFNRKTCYSIICMCVCIFI